MNLIIELQYFSPFVAFKYSIVSTNIFFDIYEKFRKMSFRNRCVIATANGLQNLTVPIEGGRDQKAAFKDLRIANRYDWQMQHWRTISSAYSRSPWFGFYEPGLFPLYQKRFEFLTDWNLATFDWACQVLGFNPTIHLKFDQEIPLDIDLRDRWLPKNYCVDQTETFPHYRQVFEEKIGFHPNLSILDLIFCEGKNAKNLLV